MAATLEARRLTEAHRLAQARLGTQVVADMFTVWRLLDVDRLDRTFDRWLTAVVPIVQARRTTSARLAANYLTTFRVLELGDDTFTPVLAEEATEQAVVTSMLVTGPAAIRSARAKGVPSPTAVATAQARSAAAAMRHALGGGRDTIAATAAADPKALGWARATAGKACHFCAMLAARGPVFSDRTVSFRAHDGCSCSAEPTYHRDDPWPAGARRYRELWNTATAGKSGAEARNAFRDALA